MTPPRIRGLVDKLDRAVRLEVYAKPAEKRARKNEALRVKMEILKAFAVISAAPPASADCEFHGSDKAACEQYSGGTPCVSADAVSVPVELMELEWLEGWLRFAAEPIGQECCGRGGQECCGCPDPVYPGLEDVGRAMDERAKELRALLAQSESKVKP